MVDQAIVSAYSDGQIGGDLPYFVGRQYGSGWLKTIARFAFPILKRVGRVAAKTAQDVIQGDKKVLPSLMDNTMAEVGNLVTGPKKRRRKAPPVRMGKKKRRGGGEGIIAKL